MKKREKGKKAKKVKTISVRLTNSRITRKWDPFALGYAWAALCALWILSISILGKFGYFMEYVRLIQSLFPFYTLGISGIVVGVAGAALCGLIFGTLTAWLYNKFL